MMGKENADSSLRLPGGYFEIRLGVVLVDWFEIIYFQRNTKFSKESKFGLNKSYQYFQFTARKILNFCKNIKIFPFTFVNFFIRERSCVFLKRSSFLFLVLYIKQTSVENVSISIVEWKADMKLITPLK